MVEIRSEKQLRDWLSDVDPDKQGAFVTRNALRQLISLGTLSEKSFAKLAFQVVRASFVASVASARPSSSSKAVAEVMWQGAYGTADAVHRKEDYGALQAALAAMEATSRKANAFNFSNFGQSLALEMGAHEEFWRTIEADALVLEENDVPAIFERPLWTTVEHAPAVPLPIKPVFRNFQERLLELGPDGGFWSRWYVGMTAGKAIPWALQEMIVSELQREDWEKGPEHVAGLIREIEARHDLKTAISELENSGSAALPLGSRHGIGGNSPPVPIDDFDLIERELTIIWAGLEDLKQEADDPNPNKAKVSAAIEAMTSALTAVTRWIASKGDLAVETLIKWGIPLVGAKYLADPAKVEAVIEAAKAWLAAL